LLELPCENRIMSEEAWRARETPEDAEHGARRDRGGPQESSPSSAPPFDASASGEQRSRADLPIRADREQLRIGELDLLAVRTVLAELGAHGSSSLDGMSVDGTIVLLEGIVGLESALESVRARAVVHLEGAVKEDCILREESPRQAARVARSEAARALKKSRSVAGRTLATSRRLVRSMPGMLTALSQGQMVPQAAHKVGSVVGPATPEQRRQVDEILTSRLPTLEACGPLEWGDEAAKVLHALDPEGAAARHHEAKKDRHVTVRRTDHGMAQVTAVISGIDGARIRKGLSVAAESARAQGDRRGHQQIMADLFADALIGRGDGVDPTTLDVGIVITDRSLLSPAHADAALVEGFGAVPYEHAREEMLRAAQSEDDPELALTLRRLYADPDVGDLVAVESTARAFPPALKRFLMIAHQTCRAPHCDAPIRQMDHIVPWSQGGETSLDNGNGLCAGDNQKESSGERAEVVRDEDGKRRTVRWTTRYGQTASRGAIDLDPLGTYCHRRAKELEQSTERSTRPDVAPADVAAVDVAEHGGTQQGGASPYGGPGTMTLDRALADLRVRLIDLPVRHGTDRPGRHPGDWIVLRGSRGR
jgi:5-methylcytosine-specific restriction endonuclease McrA